MANLKISHEEAILQITEMEGLSGLLPFRGFFPERFSRYREYSLPD